jgi:hypothetical protein
MISNVTGAHDEQDIIRKSSVICCKSVKKLLRNECYHAIKGL